MLVFAEQKLVFLATPKTGSTAIAAALAAQAAISVQRPPVLKHTTLHRYHRFIRPYLEAALGPGWRCVALMREPRDWLGSWYRYRSRPEQSDPLRSTRGLSFDDFVTDWCRDPRPAHADVGHQARFLRPRQGHSIDHLFRYEDMPGFTAFMAAQLGCQIALPQLNVSPPGATLLRPETAALLRETAQEDYAMYHAIGNTAAAG